MLSYCVFRVMTVQGKELFMICPGPDGPVPAPRGQHAEQVMVWMGVITENCCSSGEATELAI